MKQEHPEQVADTTFGGATPALFDPELVRHQAENDLKLPLRDQDTQVGC